MDWVHLAQVKDRRRTLLKTAMSLWVPHNPRKILTSRRPVSLQWQILLNEVSRSEYFRAHLITVFIAVHCTIPLLTQLNPAGNFSSCSFLTCKFAPWFLARTLSTSYFHHSQHSPARLLRLSPSRPEVPKCPARTCSLIPLSSEVVFVSSSCSVETSVWRCWVWRFRIPSYSK